MKKAFFLSKAIIMISFFLISCNDTSSNDNSSQVLLLNSPLVLSTTPTNGETAVPDSSSVVVTFSQTINQSTVTTETFVFYPAITGSYAAIGPAVTFQPTGGFQPATPYTVTIPAGGIMSTNGFPVEISYQFAFTTQ